MSNIKELLPLLAANTLLNSVSTPHQKESSFQLPDIPEDARIWVHTPKVKKHATKRRVNKLHERRRK